MKLRVAVFNLVLVLLVMGCESNVAYQDPAENNSEPAFTKVDVSNDSLAAHAVNTYGFDSQSVEKRDDVYRFERDILMRVSRIKDEMQKQQTIRSVGPERLRKQEVGVSPGNSVTTPNVRSITYGFTVSVQEEWREGMRQAAQEWQDLSASDIRLSETSYSNADIKIETFYTSGSAIAQAYYPVGGHVGSPIQVNRRYNGRSVSFMKHVMAHEIGHTIGFAHTNWEEANNSEPYYHVVGTPYDEYDSVMDAYTSSGWDGFSDGDKKAARVMYPNDGALNSFLPNEPDIRFLTNIYGSIDGACITPSEKFPAARTKLESYNYADGSSIDVGSSYSNGNIRCLEGEIYDPSPCTETSFGGPAGPGNPETNTCEVEGFSPKCYYAQYYLSGINYRGDMESGFLYPKRVKVKCDYSIY